MKTNEENPFATPVQSTDYVSGPLPITSGGGYVRQVKPLCICMMVQGVLEIAIGLLYVGLGFGMPQLMQFQGQAQNQMPAEQMQMMQTMFVAVYGVMGGFAMLAGFIRFMSGFRGLTFRSYRLGVASHFVGLFSLTTCYCLPTALALCVWGCIVYFTSEVKHAFRMRAEGHEPADIEMQFSGYRPPAQYNPKP